MSGTEFERPPAKSIETLDLHLLYVQRQLATLVAAMPQMATKSDIADLARRMDGYATKDELRALEQKLQSGSVESTFERWTANIQRFGAACAVLGGAAVLIAKMMGKL
jgi:hypothetical protein